MSGSDIVGRFAKDGLIVAGRDHFKTGGDRPGAQDVVLANHYVFQALLFPLLGNVFRYFVIVNGARWVRDGSEIAMLLANFFGGDIFFSLPSRMACCAACSGEKPVIFVSAGAPAAFLSEGIGPATTKIAKQRNKKTMMRWMFTNRSGFTEAESPECYFGSVRSMDCMPG